MHDTSVPVDRGRISVWYRPAMPGRPTVVLLHGLTGTSRWWVPVISRLPEPIGVIAPDLRGRGQSFETPGPFDLHTLASDISIFLNHFEIPSTTVVGYSMGAWVATVYGSSRPRRVNGVVLVDGGLPIEVPPEAKPEAVLDDVVGPALARFSMSFGSIEEYLEFWRRHSALSGRWDQSLDGIFAYDIHEVRGGLYQSRANHQSIIEGAEAFLFDEQAKKAIYEVTAPTRLLIVDHGMVDEPGGFMSEDAAKVATVRNPNLRVERLTGLNHYTVLLGAGASNVASAVTSLL